MKAKSRFREASCPHQSSELLKLSALQLFFEMTGNNWKHRAEFVPQPKKFRLVAEAAAVKSRGLLAERDDSLIELDTFLTADDCAVIRLLSPSELLLLVTATNDSSTQFFVSEVDRKGARRSISEPDLFEGLQREVRRLVAPREIGPARITRVTIRNEESMAQELFGRQPLAAPALGAKSESKQVRRRVVSH